MLENKTFEEIYSMHMALSPTKLKHMFELNKDIQFNDEKLYSKALIDVDVNKDAVKNCYSYSGKIGMSDGHRIRECLTRRGERVLLVGDAGAGKTYVHLKEASELNAESVNKDVVYLLCVPASKQSNQNQENEDVKKFGFISVVGEKNKLDTDDGIHFSKKLKKGHRKFSCVYDLTYDVVEASKKEGLEVVLIVDEVHKLVSKFRAKAIAGVEKAMDEADMVILMTATPEKCKLKFKCNEIITFEPEKINYNLRNFEIVYSDKWEKTLIREINRANKESLVPVINMSISLDEMKAFKKTLEDGYNYVVELVSSENNNSEVYAGIIKNGKIPDGIDVILTTSAIETGISMKSTNIVPMMVYSDMMKVSSDNIIQYFARPREQVERGILILKNRFNDINKVLADMKGLGQNEEYKKVYDLNVYIKLVNDDAQDTIAMMRRSLQRMLMTTTVRQAVDHIKHRLDTENSFSQKVVVFDEYTMEFYIDIVSAINVACQIRDTSLVTGGILDLQTHFMKSIFYERIEIRYDDVTTMDKEESEKIDEILKSKKEISKANKELKKAQEERFREFFKDKEFIRLLPALVKDKLNVVTLKEYDTPITFKELLAFKKSSLYSLVIKISTELSMDEIALLMTSRYEGSGEYISMTDIDRIYEASSNVLQNKIGANKNDKCAYNVLSNIIDDAKTKGGKQSSEKIMLSRDLFLILYSELVRTGQKGFTSKKIKAVLKDAPPRKKFNYKSYYTKDKLDELHKALSNKKGEITPATKEKLLKEIRVIYNTSITTKNDSIYHCINSKLNTFNFDYHLQNVIKSR